MRKLLRILARPFYVLGNEGAVPATCQRKWLKKQTENNRFSTDSTTVLQSRETDFVTRTKLGAFLRMSSADELILTFPNEKYRKYFM
jgi:hypothetical protein